MVSEAKTGRLDSGRTESNYFSPAHKLPVLQVCGDVHGQYYDLLNIFKINGAPSETNPYLFNGDFVDRGSFSMECILLLFAYKVLATQTSKFQVKRGGLRAYTWKKKRAQVAYPKHFYLARGNHETKSMNKLYGFQGEVRRGVYLSSSKANTD